MTATSSARSLIASAKRIMLITHVAPDGDAIGSLLGFSWALRAAGKETLPVSPDGCPDTFRFLPGSADIRNKAQGPVDLIITVDCADLGRAGKPAEKLDRPPDINIDHHSTNPNFGRLNFVDAASAATAEILTDLLPALGLSLAQPVADCLLCGVVSDTLGFSTTNTTARSLAAAQTLMAAGADLPSIYNLSLNRRSFNAVQLWGQALTRAALDSKLVWTTIPLSVKAAVGYKGKGDADLVNVLTTVNEADIFVVLIEHENNEVKISWRARPGHNVAKIAKAFGGGGHISAAGANVKGTLDEVQEKVLAATRQMMNGE